MNIKKPYVEIEEIARYETDTYLFFFGTTNFGGEKYPFLSYCPIYKNSATKINVDEIGKIVRSYPCNVSRAIIEKEIKKISGCDTFKISLYDKDNKIYRY